MSLPACAHAEIKQHKPVIQTDVRNDTKQEETQPSAAAAALPSDSLLIKEAAVDFSLMSAYPPIIHCTWLIGCCLWLITSNLPD